MSLDRRQFLKALGGGLLVGIGFFYPGLPHLWRGPEQRVIKELAPAGTASTSVYQVEGPDPTYAAGEVIEKTSEGVILKSDIGLRAVRLPPGTVVWKEYETTPDVIQIHDWLDVKGTPLPDGTLLARSGWVFVNIARRDGQVVALIPQGLVLQHNKGQETIELSSWLEVIRADDGKPVPTGVDALRSGMHIGAVGLRLSNGHFRATRIWIP
jgi:hypothetical protein